MSRPQNAGHVSPSAAQGSAVWGVNRILVTISSELIPLPVCDRHPKLNIGQCPFAR